MEERVNHPSHYTWLKKLCGIEVIDITRHMNFNLGNVIKYVLRHGKKKEEGVEDKAIEDLKKAVWYLNDEIKRINKYDTVTKDNKIPYYHNNPDNYYSVISDIVTAFQTNDKEKLYTNIKNLNNFKTFYLTKEEMDVVAEFNKEVSVPTAIGGGLTYHFTPTSLGTIVEVTNGENKLTVRDSSDW